MQGPIYDFREYPSRVFHVKRDCSFTEIREKGRAMDIVEQIRVAVKPKGRKTELAKHMGWHPNVVTNILKGDRRVQVEELEKLNEFLDRGVPIRGSVGAGDEFYAFNADDPNEMAPGISRGSVDTVAVEIRGTSLGPGLDGWLAYYDDRQEPMSPALLGRLCVVGLDDGRILIKIPRQAPRRGTYHLFPNAGGEMIPDAKVEWAARVIELRPKS
jgi:hypothetical protein